MTQCVYACMQLPSLVTGASGPCTARLTIAGGRERVLRFRAPSVATRKSPRARRTDGRRRRRCAQFPGQLRELLRPRFGPRAPGTSVLSPPSSTRQRCSL